MANNKPQVTRTDARRRAVEALYAAQLQTAQLQGDDLTQTFQHKLDWARAEAAQLAKKLGSDRKTIEKLEKRLDDQALALEEAQLPPERQGISRKIAKTEGAKENLELNMFGVQTELVEAKAYVASFKYAAEIIAGVSEHLDSIDEMIASFSRSWTIERMPKVDLAIIRVATWEILYNDDVPNPVAITEGGILADELGTDDSKRFVAGLLTGIAAGA